MLNFDLSRPGAYKDGLLIGPPEASSEFAEGDLSDTEWTSAGSYTRREGKERLVVVRSSFNALIAICLEGGDPDSVVPIRLRPVEGGKETYTGLVEAASGAVYVMKG